MWNNLRLDNCHYNHILTFLFLSHKLNHTLLYLHRIHHTKHNHSNIFSIRIVHNIMCRQYLIHKEYMWKDIVHRPNNVHRIHLYRLVHTNVRCLHSIELKSRKCNQCRKYLNHRKYSFQGIVHKCSNRLKRNQ